MEVESAKPTPLEPPRGFYPARVDDKGRLKLPVAFQQYLVSLGEKVFVTTVDLTTARIYPVSVWKENEALFEAAGEDAESAEDIAFLANAYGADSDVDGQGRVMIHPDLRRKLDIENKQVYLDSYKGRINVYSQAVYEARKERATQDVAVKLKAMEQRGLK